MKSVRVLFRPVSTESKSDLGVLFKKMNRDSKLMFGDLLETSKIKKKRIYATSRIQTDNKQKNDDFLKNIQSNISISKSNDLKNHCSFVNDSKQLLIEEDRCSFAQLCDTTGENVSNYKFPSVTYILNETMSEKSRAALENWKKGMIEKLGEEGFIKFNREQMDMGSQMHSKIQSYLLDQEPSISSYTEVENCWKSLECVIPNISSAVLVEKMVVHNDLEYKGIVDCVAFYRNTPVVIEWKKSSRPKPSLYSTFDAPIQLAAYMGAVNNDPSYSFKVEEGLVVIAYSDGHPANVFKLTKELCLTYWSAWIQRLNTFKQSRGNNVL
ncbi:mitochondrial genome maintenance exonuclease 1-like [Adelges cooleyi]|uniref:mitochondrial genome maintenance exonuclease 1-like n=1 Tax=Adelges cooleyi TaxID=133065 RepID=UPI00217FB2E3|nr:mitochondrial genome maintenance exonuclease 1-like [Adelges cooleyi]